MDTKIEIPEDSSDITSTWVSTITGDCVSSNPEDFHIEENIQEGNGFMSSVYRISYKKAETGSNHQIIVKLLPKESKWLEFALVDASDEREIKFYSTILPDLLEVVPELEENVCKFYHGSVTKDEGKKKSMIVMEDLKAIGFDMMDFSGEKCDEVVNSLVTFLARLHFAAFAVQAKKGVPLPQLYPFMQGIVDNPEWFAQIDALCESGFQQLKKLLADENIPGTVYEDFERLKPLIKDVTKKVSEIGRKQPGLIHGDVWPPNIFVHSSQPGKVKVLDWQLMAYRDVTFDLGIMLYSVLPKEKLTRENMTRFLKRYHEEFEKLCKRGDFGGNIKSRSWEELENFFFTWASAFTFVVILPSIDCYTKDFTKYANVFRVLSEEIRLVDFLVKDCSHL